MCTARSGCLLLKAADYAKEYYQNQQALSYYDRLLKLLDDNSRKQPKKNKRRADILLKKGNILELTGEWEEAEKQEGGSGSLKI